LQPAVLSSPPYADPVAGSGSETFGPYRLDALIGRGGMGEVYRATDLAKNRVVALKRLPPQLATDPEFQDRFRREAEMTAGLREPHVIPIHDYGEIDGRLYIDMRLVEGMDLAEVLARHGPLPPPRAVDIITQVAAALDAAHADGLVHRDVKPSNVLISTHNQTTDYVYLVDFGIAHSAAATRLTVTGSTIGTVAYIAPERLVSDHWDHRVDIYALGCVLSEILTGQKPFPVSDAQAQIFAHLHAPPPRPSRLRAGVPPGFDDVVSIAMAKDPARRYPSAGALAAAAQAVLTPLPDTVPTGAQGRGRRRIRSTGPAGGSAPAVKKPRRPGRKRGAAVVVLAAALAAALGFGGPTSPPPPPVPAATVEREIAQLDQDQTGQPPQPVTCPADLPAEDGAELRCKLASQGRQFGVSVTVTSIQDGHVEYDIVIDIFPS
jgi:serine/threonine protein kinase